MSLLLHIQNLLYDNSNMNYANFMCNYPYIITGILLNTDISILHLVLGLVII